MDTGSFYRKLEEHFIKELPLVVYRKPGKTAAIRGLLQQDLSVFTSESLSEVGFIFAPFYSRKQNILIPLEKSEFIEWTEDPQKERKRLSETKISTDEVRGSEKQGIFQDSAEHIRLVEKSIEVLKTGGLEKVVLSRKEEVALMGKHPLNLFQELVQEYPTAFVYCWYHPEVGLWLGATPETLVEVNGLNFKTMALAATQSYSGTMEVDWGAKEKQEQQYVTDSILEDLRESKVVEAIGTSDPYSVRAGGLLHLRTDISGRINAVEDLGAIVEKLHPTPAVCGFPTEAARNFILQEENYDREFYTGYLGELNFQEKISRSRNRRNTENLAYQTVRKNSHLFVNLRCMKLEGNNAVLFVGGGITKDSIAQDEWQETVNKSQTMKRVLEK